MGVNASYLQPFDGACRRHDLDLLPVIGNAHHARDQHTEVGHHELLGYLALGLACLCTATPCESHAVARAVDRMDSGMQDSMDSGMQDRMDSDKGMGLARI